MFSFHGGHSGEFCFHAAGRLEGLVAAAAARGFTSLGLSEHQPPATDEDRYPDEVDAGLSAAEIQARFDRYAAEVAPALRERYAGRLAILVGMETEVVPSSSYAAWIRGLRDLYGLDYVVGSVHHVDGLGFDMSAEQYAATREAAGGFEAMCLRYFAHQRALVEQVRPEVLGHFDLILKYAPPGTELPPAAWRAALENLELAGEIGCVLEINARGLRVPSLARPYPSVALLREARRRGVPVTLGDDAHAPEQVGVGLERCIDVAAEAGYTHVVRLERLGEGVLRHRFVELGELVLAD